MFMIPSNRLVYCMFKAAIEWLNVQFYPQPNNHSHLQITFFFFFSSAAAVYLIQLPSSASFYFSSRTIFYNRLTYSSCISIVMLLPPPAPVCRFLLLIIRIIYCAHKQGNFPFKALTNDCVQLHRIACIVGLPNGHTSNI